MPELVDTVTREKGKQHIEKETRKSEEVIARYEYAF